MCGLAGILRFDGRPPEAGRLEAARRRLLCRGPDGSDVRINGACGLAHTRLAITDPAGGRQPMTLSADGTVGGSGGVRGGLRGGVSVVFNGEIHNHRALRRRLESRGHRFTTDHSDTEALLHGYREWGAGLVERLEGMFAFALWDPARRSLLLARDRTGQKPLYLHRDGRRLVFASLIGALRPLLDAAPPVDPDALNQYLTLGYTLDRTLLAGVEELPPGCLLRVGADARGERRRYWEPPHPSPPPAGDEEPRPSVERLLGEAVDRRLEADVGLGCFLSGGVDSSLIAALAQRRLRERGERLKTFSVAMPDARYDESPWAKRVAEHLGTEHTQLTAEPDVRSDLRRLIGGMGEPLADSSILPTYWLSRAARRHVAVALSGDGGDELFAGYDRYRALRLLHRHRWWLSRVPSFALGGGGQKSHRARLGRLVRAARAPDPAAQYLSMIRLFTPDQLHALGVQGGGAEPPGLDVQSFHGDPMDSARRWDLLHYLPGDLLRKVDRASMAVALEVRSPMLDTAVVERAARLPARLLTPGGRAKGLLKDIAARYLPADVLSRGKMGFAVPIGPWFAGPLRPLLKDHLLDAPRLTGLGFHRSTMERWIAEHAAGRRDHTHRLFSLLSLSVWLEGPADDPPKDASPPPARS